MKNDQLFDDLLKSKLENLSEPYHPALWAAFEEQLDLQAPDNAPSPVDQTVLRALESLEAPYNPAHWDLLEGRMNDNAQLRRRIWMTKVAEAAIFLLLLLNLDALINDVPWIKPDSKQKNELNEPVAARKSPRNKGEKTHGSRSGFAGNSSRENAQTGDFWADSPLPALPGANLPENGSNTTTGAVEIPNSSRDGVAASNGIFTGNQMISLLDPLPVLRADKPLAYLLQPGVYPYQIIIKPHSNKDLYASASASFDQNYIRAGADLKKANGASYGASVGMRKGKWGIETGLLYSGKTYQPKKEEEIWVGNVNSGYLSSYADQVSADLVSVPLKLSRRIARVGKTTVRATAGATASFAVQKDFRYKRVHYPGAGPSTLPVDNHAQPVLEKDGKGLLENGRFDDNFYATADAGIRIEHPVGRILTLFVEPSYHAAITKKGIGPNASRIHTASLQAGVMASL